MSNSTIDDETKLKDSLVQKLKNCGYLTEIKAELNAKLCQILTNDLNVNTMGNHHNNHNINNDINDDINDQINELPRTTSTLCLEPYLQSVEGTLALYLIKDMLDCLGLYYSSMIFHTEIGGDDNLYKKHTKLQLQDIIKSINLTSIISLTSSNEQVERNSFGNNILNGIQTSSSSSSQLIKTTNNNSEISEDLNINKSRPLLVEILHKILHEQIKQQQQNLFMSNETFIKSPKLNELERIPLRNQHDKAEER